MANAVKISPRLESNEIKTAKDFGKLIKYKRTSMGKTLVEVAQLCNISDRTLSKLENGAEGSRLSTALYVGGMLGITITELEG